MDDFGHGRDMLPLIVEVTVTHMKMFMPCFCNYGLLQSKMLTFPKAILLCSFIFISSVWMEYK